MVTIELRGSGEKLIYGHKYTQEDLSLLSKIDSLFRKDYFLAGYITMVLDEVGIPIARSLARFPEVDGVRYWTGVEFRIPVLGQVALLLPLNQYKNSGPIVLVDHYTTNVELVDDLLKKILVTVTDEHIRKYAPDPEDEPPMAQ